MDVASLIARRAAGIEVSGIRRVFDLGKSLANPVNLSIGQPHFEVPAPIRDAAKHAIDHHKNGYTVTQGAAELRDRLKVGFPAGRDVIVTSGTSGGLLLALFAVVDPGDEVLYADPYFVAYPNMVALCGGVPVPVDTYPDFQLTAAKVEAALTPRTKVVILCSPGNPTGAVASEQQARDLADLCRRKGVLLISDEIYRAFHYDAPAVTPATFDPDVLVIEGFGKTYGVTGWRLGYAVGPTRLIDEMMKLQQCTFVCAPSAFQHACVAALDFNVTGIVSDYKNKRDRLCVGLRDKFEFTVPGGAFYLFPKVPKGTGTEFVTEAVKRNLLVIPGGVFSRKDTHFRISYAASDATLDKGIEILNAMA